MLPLPAALTFDASAVWERFHGRCGHIETHGGRARGVAVVHASLEFRATLDRPGLDDLDLRDARGSTLPAHRAQLDRGVARIARVSTAVTAATSTAIPTAAAARTPGTVRPAGCIRAPCQNRTSNRQAVPTRTRRVAHSMLAAAPAVDEPGDCVDARMCDTPARKRQSARRPLLRPLGGRRARMRPWVRAGW